jgi:hypothetical protein
MPFETGLSKSYHKCDVDLLLYEETEVITYLYTLFQRHILFHTRQDWRQQSVQLFQSVLSVVQNHHLQHKFPITMVTQKNYLQSIVMYRPNHMRNFLQL